ncbi:MAG: hypothetical protein IKA74_00305 [Clostridia bacterium]|nr:hypothetical protein [Clostridia bacterium]
MKRIISIILIAVLLSALVSCSQTTESDSEIAEITEALVKKSIILNKIYWGEGIDIIEGGETTSDGKYVIADMSSLSEYEISDINTLKSYTRSVYTENECDSIFKNYLAHSAYTDSFGGYMYTEILNRYISDGEGRIFVYTGLEDLIKDSVVEYDFSSIRVVKRERKTVHVEISVTVKSSGDTQGYADVLPLEIRKENQEYRLNTPTYCVYDKE